MAKAKEAREVTQREQQRGERRQDERQSPRGMRTTDSQRGGGERQAGLARREQYAPSPWAGSPFTFMRRFSEEMDRLFEDFSSGRGFLTPTFGREFGREVGRSIWSPQTEVFERGGQLVVRADLPGMTRDDIDVDITDDALVIRGERREEREEDEEGYYRTERSYGSFYRSIPLPEGVSAENANATLRNGVLEITMEAPQRQSRGRRLEISEGTEAGEQPQRGSAKAAGR